MNHHGMEKGNRQGIRLFSSEPGFNKSHVVALIVFSVGLGTEAQGLPVPRGNGSPSLGIEYLTCRKITEPQADGPDQHIGSPSA